MKSEKKTGADRAQPSVTNEWWSDDRVKTYLDLQNAGDEASDFHVLQKAYRGMVPEAFGRFIGFFVGAGRNLNETNKYGETILSIVSQHRNSKEYAEILKKAGAR